MSGVYDEFHRIAEDLKALPTEFSALFRQAELQLLKEKPLGFDISEIGERAWSRLPLDRWPEALRTLFYCYWIVQREEQRDDELREKALRGEATYLDESALGLINDSLSCGPQNGYATEVDFNALSAVVAELQLLRRRLDLLRHALADNPDGPF